MKTPRSLHKLPVLSPAEAAEQGFQSITVHINSVTEPAILASVALHRDPDRAVFISFGDNNYELAIRREDVRHVDPE